MVSLSNNNQKFRPTWTTFSLSLLLLLWGVDHAVFVTAFAGGFGNKPTKKKVKDKNQSKKKGFAEIITPPPPTTKPSLTDNDMKIASDNDNNNEPKLDKWGLPIATAETIFPPMPKGTELIPIDNERQYTISDMQELLKSHVNLQLHNYFDNDTCLAKDGSGIQVHLLHESPPVLSFDNYFTPQECQAVKNIALSNNNKKVYQVNSATFAGALSTRTSTSWFCHFDTVPQLLAKTNKLLNIPIITMEEPQIVRYQVGQEFSWHYDEVPPPQLSNGGQRIGTLLVYLNDLPESSIMTGGGTVFRDLQTSTTDSTPLTMQPKCGSALLFFPSFGNGQPDDRTLHKSEIMKQIIKTKRGNNNDNNEPFEKWIIQMWIHERDYTPVLPPGNSQLAAEQVMKEYCQKLGYE